LGIVALMSIRFFEFCGMKKEPLTKRRQRHLIYFRMIGLGLSFRKTWASHPIFFKRRALGSLMWKLRPVRDGTVFCWLPEKNHFQVREIEIEWSVPMRKFQWGGISHPLFIFSWLNLLHISNSHKESNLATVSRK
jgi:hypothetical protein